MLQKLAQGYLIAAITLIYPSVSTAANFTMDPGQTIVVPASQQPTSVSCRESGDGTVLEKYCICIDKGSAYMKRLNRVYVWSDGQVREVFFGDYSTMRECEDAKAAQQACQ